MAQRGVVQRGRRGARGQAGLLGGRYALRSLVGEGGMAEVFSALDGVLDRPVAVKVLREHLAHDPAAPCARRGARAHQPRPIDLRDEFNILPFPALSRR